MAPRFIEIVASVLLALAVGHTFSVAAILQFSRRFPKGSARERLFHFLSEVEAVFGIWATVLVMTIALAAGKSEAIRYLESLRFTEPAFVFVVMAIASSRPLIFLANRLIGTIASALPLSESMAFYAVALTLGPLLGSLITEPAAMTVTALLLKERYFERKISLKLKYATVGALFVNVSIGGALTHFAAPPVVMVAATWGWDTGFMLSHFGWKAAAAVMASTVITCLVFRKELTQVSAPSPAERAALTRRAPIALVILHALFLASVVSMAHHMVVFLGIFLFYVGFTTLTRTHQDDLPIRSSLLVGFFLAGLVVLGGLQNWWLEPLLRSLDKTTLFLGAAALTAVTDNAALTYLGAQVEGIPDAMKYSLVAGAITGGGLTVIANAPNPAGYGILKESFGKEGIRPAYLFVAALPATLLAGAAFFFL